VQLQELILDKSLRELTVRGTPGFPIAVYDNDMQGLLKSNIPWHWHNELEFAVVQEGKLFVSVEGQSVTLRPGQGVFINSGVLHSMGRSGGAACKMATAVFDALLLCGTQASVMFSHYLQPLMTCKELPMVALDPQVSWHKEILDRFWDIFSLYHAQPPLWELDIQDHMIQIWRTLYARNAHALTTKAEGRRDQRMKQMLGYLQENLSQMLTLEDIAESAGISTRECTRCFRDVLGISPMVYLTQLRVRAAAVLLEQSDDPITEIGNAVGFGSPSYFGKVFRDHTGQSPRQYRQKVKQP